MIRIVLLVSALLALSGCASHYVVTLSNGSQIDASSKPKLKGNVYVFKNALGEETTIASGRVAEISPASLVEGKSDNFKAPTPR